MEPIWIAVLSSVGAIVIREVIDWAKRKGSDSVFTDAERKYIEDEIAHKLNNFEVKADGRYTRKKTWPAGD